MDTQPTNLARRKLLTALPAAAALSGLAKALEFPTRREAMLKLIAVLGDLNGRQAPWWYTGYIYGLRPGEEPRKLVRFEGTEINLFTPGAGGTFSQTARTTTFFSDPESEQILDTWINPYNGKSQVVKANLLGGGGRLLWSDEGLLPQFGASALGGASSALKPTPLSVRFVSYDRWVWVRNDRVYPPGLPQPLGESSTTLVQLRDLQNRRLSNIPGTFSSTYMARWPTWMGMQGEAGHVIWHADGIKLRTTDDLPAAFLDRVRRLHPKQLIVTPV